MKLRTLYLPIALTLALLAAVALSQDAEKELAPTPDVKALIQKLGSADFDERKKALAVPKPVAAAGPRVDVTLPGRPVPVGTLHPVTLVLRDNGAGLPPDFDFNDSGGFGYRMIRLLAKQIKGKLDVQSTGGVEITVTWEGR